MDFHCREFLRNAFQCRSNRLKNSPLPFISINPIKFRINKYIPACSDQKAEYQPFKPCCDSNIFDFSYNNSVIAKQNAPPSVNSLVVEKKYQNCEISKCKKDEPKDNSTAESKHLEYVRFVTLCHLFLDVICNHQTCNR